MIYASEHSYTRSLLIWERFILSDETVFSVAGSFLNCKQQRFGGSLSAFSTREGTMFIRSLVFMHCYFHYFSIFLSHQVRL